MASVIFFSDVELNSNQVLDVVIHNVNDLSNIVSPVAGQVVFNKNDYNFYGYDGTTWIKLSGSNTSPAYACMTMYDNSTPTVIPSLGTYVKANGTTNGSSLVNFVHSDNRLIYSGSIKRDFLINFSGSIISNSSPVLSVRAAIYKNGAMEFQSILSKDPSVAIVSGNFILNLSNGDYIEVYITSYISSGDLVLYDLTLTVSGL